MPSVALRKGNYRGQKLNREWDSQKGTEITMYNHFTFFSSGYMLSEATTHLDQLTNNLVSCLSSMVSLGPRVGSAVAYRSVR